MYLVEKIVTIARPAANESFELSTTPYAQPQTTKLIQIGSIALRFSKSRKPFRRPKLHPCKTLTS